MRHYTFALRHDADVIEDESGIWLEDRERACAYAREVATELICGQEEHTRSWCLDVYEDGKHVHELLFASIDPTLAHLRPRVRATVEQTARQKRGLRDVLSAVRATLRESKALVARSRGKPYLATVAGEPVITTKKPAPGRNDRRRGGGKGGK